MHFGHCETFVFFDIEQHSKKVIGKKELVPPPHEPGILPVWISKQGVELVIVGGMGQHAQELFKQNNVKVIVGVAEVDPEKIIRNYLNNDLKTGSNTCDH